MTQMIIPTGYAQVNFIGGGTAYPRGWQVVFGVKNDADMSALLLATGCASLWHDNMPPVMSDQATLTSVLAKLGPNLTGASHEHFVDDPGTLTGQALPAQTCVLGTKVTTGGGRKGKGRCFFPGATEAQTDGGGVLNSAALTAWQNAVTGLRVDMEALDIPMALLHAEGVTTPYLIEGVQIQSLMATQRRRLRRVGGRRSGA